MSQTLPVVVGIVGATGLIGSTLVKQIQSQSSVLQRILNATVSIDGITNSKSMKLGSVVLSDGNVKDMLAQGEIVDLKAFGAKLYQVAEEKSKGSQHRPCAVVVDCTASDAAPSMYQTWMDMGLHIVTPNKKFGAGCLARYKGLNELSAQTGRQFLAEASVGAGLPVLSTLRGLIESGDKILKVEGILSGTLSYIFNTYKPGMAFSSVVSDAKSKGYTEPDPREDLSGMDVARKVVILARGCGVDATLESLAVESLVPEPLSQPGVTPDDYMSTLPQFDTQMAERADAADAAGQVIRYVGSVDVSAATASVKVVSYPKNHPFAQLSGTDNMIVFTTERYKQQPLIVRGPGAGAEVTAAGVLTDIIQAVRCHGNSA